VLNMSPGDVGQVACALPSELVHRALTQCVDDPAFANVCAAWCCIGGDAFVDAVGLWFALRSGGPVFVAAPVQNRL
jgi:hypothetical protein